MKEHMRYKADTTPPRSSMQNILKLMFFEEKKKKKKASKQAKRGECLPCERLVQGKRHVGKKALLAHGT